MPIILQLDRIMNKRKMPLNELAEKVGITNVNMSRIKTGKIKAIRFTTLASICDILQCQPGDILKFISDEEFEKLFGEAASSEDESFEA